MFSGCYTRREVFALMVEFRGYQNWYSTADQQYTCSWCGTPIPVGQQYRKYTIPSSETIDLYAHVTMHTECSAAWDRMDNDLKSSHSYNVSLACLPHIERCVSLACKQLDVWQRTAMGAPPVKLLEGSTTELHRMGALLAKAQDVLHSLCVRS